MIYDVCIVGSGFAGTFLALRLTDSGAETVILEAGDHVSQERGEGRTDLFSHVERGNAGFPVDFNRTIGVGGTSRKWNGVVSRFLPNDFRCRSEFGLFDDWPISYEDLRPFYDQAEVALSTQGGPELLGAEPPRGRPYPAAAEWQMQPVPEVVAAVGPGFFPLAFGVRSSAWSPLRLDEVELRRFGARGSLIPNRPVIRIGSTDGATVSHIEASRPDGSLEEVRARRIVIAAGVLETARLLLCSPSTSCPTGIGNSHGLVGRYVHAHPRFRMTVPPDGRFRGLVGVYRSYAYADAFRREELGACCVDLNFFEDPPSVDVTVEMEPSAHDTIRLDPRQRDAWGRPRVVWDMSFSDRDRSTIRRALELQKQLASALTSRPAELDPEPMLTWFHPAGGCRMGDSPSNGVVDRDCRVHGTESLYLAGSSIFPTSGAGNPTLTIVALALRLGGHLAGRAAST